MLLNMDCVTAMSLFMEPESVDAIVTDPPYELGFMGKKWDASGIANSVEMWREALRVLKPGGYLLSFGGARTYHRMACAVEDAGFDIRDQVMWVYGSGMPKGKRLLKPAHEPICVAQKAGAATMNIDACRVEPTGESKSREHEAASARTAAGATNIATTAGAYRGGDPAGRWPANLIHDGSDEVLAVFPDAPGQLAKASTSATLRNGQNIYGRMARGSNGAEPRADTGSAARFFYCAKASTAERGEGNTHPTVKPIALMRYLCRLVTPPGGTVLDPFMGSGSTGKAAKLEGLRFVGIELDDNYFQIAQRRLA